MIELSKIAAIAGIGGLFQIKASVKNGIMMESLDEKKTKVITNAASKVSVLTEISIYTTSAEGSVSLEFVFKSIYEKYGTKIPASSKSDGADLKNLLKSVLADVDFERVYVSDIKKVVNWFGILAVQAPELLVKKVEETIVEKETDETKEVVAEKKPVKKAKATKAAESTKESPEEAPTAKKPTPKKK